MHHHHHQEIHFVWLSDIGSSRPYKLLHTLPELEKQVHNCYSLNQTSSKLDLCVCTCMRRHVYFISRHRNISSHKKHQLCVSVSRQGFWDTYTQIVEMFTYRSFVPFALHQLIDDCESERK